MTSSSYQYFACSVASAAWLIAGAMVYSVHGEVIYLKSGGSIRGIITQREGATVTVDIGFGLTSLDTAEIDSIGTSSDEERMVLQQRRQSGYGGGNQSLPDPLKSWVESTRQLRTMRFKAVSRQAELERLDGEIDSLERAIRAGTRDYDAIDKQLNVSSYKTWDERFALIGKAHQINASILSCQNTILEKQSNQRKGNPFLLIYIDSLERFDELFKSFKKTFGATEARNHPSIVNEIEKDLRECKTEFRTVAPDVTFIQGNHIIVPVVINKRGRVLLLLDTGASAVVLSRAAASRLGIDYESGTTVIATLANGETEKGHAVLLRSVAVGDFSTENVRAAVFDKPPGQGIDGLLGMSYLQRFALHIDPVNKKFLLKKISAR